MTDHYDLNILNVVKKTLYCVDVLFRNAFEYACAKFAVHTTIMIRNIVILGLVNVSW